MGDDVVNVLGRQLSELVTRLDAIEAALTRVGQVGPGGPRVDPSPEDWIRWFGGGFRPPGVVVDPAPDDLGRYPWPGRWFELVRPPRPPWPGDPAPIDISRFTRVQLQLSLHSIAAERTRLDAVEQLVKEQLDRLDQG